MPRYKYIALDKEKKQIKGFIDGADVEHVKSLIRADGNIPLSIKKSIALDQEINLIGKPVKNRELSVFCRQFQSIITAGVPVVKAIEMLAEQSENIYLKKALEDIKVLVERGSTLSEALAQRKEIFPQLMVYLVEAGESSGNLETAFDRIAAHLEKSSRIKSLVKKAMIYPVAILIVAFAVLVAMSVFVIPKFRIMLDMTGGKMPVPTQIVLGVSDFILYKWYIIAIVVIVIVAFFKWLKSTDFGKMFLSKAALKLPVFGKLTTKNACASVARTMSTLLSAGLSISSALEITAKTVENEAYKAALLDAKREVERGISLSEPLKKSEIFPAMMYQMVSVGEETGTVSDMLDKIAAYYEEEVEITTQGLTAALEPMIIVVMGVLVGFMVVAMYMPMMNVYSGLDNL